MPGQPNLAAVGWRIAKFEGDSLFYCNQTCWLEPFGPYKLGASDQSADHTPGVLPENR